MFSILGIQDGWFGQVGTNGVTWQIAILMICFALYHIIITKTRSKQDALRIFVILVLFGTYLSLQDIWFPLMYRRCGFGYFGFFLGCLLYEFCAFFMERRWVLVSVGILFTVGYFVFFELSPGNVIGKDEGSILYILTPGLILTFSQSSLLNKVSDNAIIRYLARISYFIYLLHIPVLIWGLLIIDLNHITLDYRSTGVWVGYIVITITCACVGDLLNRKIHDLIIKKRKNTYGLQQQSASL